MKKQIAISMLAALALVFAVTSAEAGDRGKHKGRHMRGDRGDRMARVIEKLDLTVEQRAAIVEVRVDAQEDAKAAVTKLRALKKEQHALWKAETIDADKVVKLQKRINKLEGELAVIRIETRIDMLDLLTAEQRAELKTLRADRSKKGKRNGKARKGDKRSKVDKASKASKRGFDKRAKRDRAARTDRGQRGGRGNGRPATANATL